MKEFLEISFQEFPRQPEGGVAVRSMVSHSVVSDSAGQSVDSRSVRSRSVVSSQLANDQSFSQWSVVNESEVSCQRLVVSQCSAVIQLDRSVAPQK